MPQRPSPGTSGAEGLVGLLVALALICGVAVYFVPGLRDALPDFSSPESTTSAPDIPAGQGFDVDEAARTYPGDDASKAAKARWMGEWAARSGLPRELPVMAALVESNLTNHQRMYDHDSLGYFQMRKSLHAERYPEFWRRPELQLKWFIATARHFYEPRFANERNWGEWCADIERPRKQYRGRYQPRLAEARELLG